MPRREKTPRRVILFGDGRFFTPYFLRGEFSGGNRIESPLYFWRKK